MCISFCHMNCQIKRVNPASVFMCKTCAGISVFPRIHSMWLFLFIFGPNSESDRAAKDKFNSKCGFESSGGDLKISIAQTFCSLVYFSVLLSERMVFGLNWFETWSTCYANSIAKQNRANAIFWFCLIFLVTYHYFRKLLQVIESMISATSSFIHSPTSVTLNRVTSFISLHAI